MGGALMKGWIAQGVRPVVVVEPNPAANLVSLARANVVRLLHSIDAVAREPVGACVVALKPQVLRTEAVCLGPVAQSGALMVSIAAGTSIASLKRAWGRGAVVARAMPNTPGAVGKGITALYAPRGVGRDLRNLAASLMRGLGETFWVTSETDIDTVTAVSGSGPAYVFLLVEVLAAAARQQGLPAVIADRLARATITGSGALLDADPRPAAALRTDVTSPHGTTEAALQVLMKKDAFRLLVGEAVAAARRRAEELRHEG
jgi:pyrroline-5-carboxylate reductase